jgi:nucleotide-binding universal stress UspA family protein
MIKAGARAPVQTAVRTSTKKRKADAMKSILSVLTDPGLAEAQLTAAAGFARRRDAHLHLMAVGVSLIPSHYAMIEANAAGGDILIAQARERCHALGDRVDSWMAAHAGDLMWSVERRVVYEGGLSSIVGPAARLADLVIAPRLAPDGPSGDVEAVLDVALQDGRAPVLIVPPGGIGAAAAPRTAVVAWNDSAPAAAALRGALPLLAGAERISVAMVAPPAHDPGETDPGHAVCQLLSRHGLKAEVAILPRTLPRLSDVLVRHLQDLDADLLVMGAWGHSRLRESIFGGATYDLLRGCPVPVLMGH